MAKKLRVGVSPITGTIFAGHVLKDGTWGANKTDVTMDALSSVVGHVENFGKPVTLSHMEGDKEVLDYTITVTKHAKDDQD